METDTLTSSSIAGMLEVYINTIFYLSYINAFKALIEVRFGRYRAYLFYEFGNTSQTEKSKTNSSQRQHAHFDIFSKHVSIPLCCYKHCINLLGIFGEQLVCKKIYESST